MNEASGYALICKMDAVRLHFEVKSIKNEKEVYFAHFQYWQLPEDVQYMFSNLDKLYEFMQNPQQFYFDDYDIQIKLVINIHSNSREYGIPLKHQKYSRIQTLKDKANQLTQEEARLKDQFQHAKEQRQNQLEELNRIENHSREENQYNMRENKILYSHITIEQEEIHKINHHLDKIRKELKILDPTVKQESIINSKQRYWINEVNKTTKKNLKELINENVNFENVKSFELTTMKMKLMGFVQIFPELQNLNLNYNQIKVIQGLGGVRNLLKLDLANNLIEKIIGLDSQIKLKQLILHHNKIKNMENIFHLAELQELSLSENYLEEIPQGIQKMYHLVELRLINNKIKVITPKIIEIKSLKMISLTGNLCFTDRTKTKDVITALQKANINMTNPVK